VSASAHNLAVAILAEGEPSKVPFYVIGALLAGWAVVLSAMGLTQPEFPGSTGRARLVMAISAVLVLGTAASAIATSSKHHAEEAAGVRGEEGPGEGTAAPQAGAQATPETPGESQAGPGSGQAQGAPSPGGRGQRLQLAADPSGQLKYDVSSLEARGGRVTIELTNESSVAHDVRIEGQGNPNLGGTRTVSDGATSATVQLRPGSYTFYCSVPGHRQGGMEGRLTVS
jgi:plastocyanin